MKKLNLDGPLAIEFSLKIKMRHISKCQTCARVETTLQEKEGAQFLTLVLPVFSWMTFHRDLKFLMLIYKMRKCPHLCENVTNQIISKVAFEIP